MNDNGFNPRWDGKKKYVFNLKMPDLAVLRIVVMDKDVDKDDFIGQFACPVDSMSPGAHGRAAGAIGC